MIDILQMREKHALQDRIELIGAVKPADVRDVCKSNHEYKPYADDTFHRY